MCEQCGYLPRSTHYHLYFAHTDDLVVIIAICGATRGRRHNSVIGLRAPAASESSGEKPDRELQPTGLTGTRGCWTMQVSRPTTSTGRPQAIRGGSALRGDSAFSLA